MCIRDFRQITFPVMMLTLIALSPCLAADLHVPQVYPTIQAGLEAMADQDTLTIFPGLYDEQDLTLGYLTGCVIRGSTGDPADVVIRAQTAGFIFQSGYLNSCTLEGITFQGADTPGVQTQAAFIQGAYTTVRRCVIRDHEVSAGWGAAFYFDEGYGILWEECEFRGNHSNNSGGAVFAFDQNAFIGCLFVDNICDGNGGAIYIWYSALVVDCTLIRNQAAKGGAIYVRGFGAALITNCTLMENEATVAGAAVYVANNELTTNPFGSVVIERTIVAQSTAGGAFHCEPDSKNFFFASNVHGNVGGDWPGGWDGTDWLYGNISADPLFCDVGADDLRLQPGSPCLPDLARFGLIGAHGEGCGSLSSAPERSIPVDRARLFQNFPNPFNPSTNIDFELAVSGTVQLEVFDVKGARVRSLLNESMGAGKHNVTWDGRDDRGVSLASGVYLFHLSTASGETTRKVMLVR